MFGFEACLGATAVTYLIGASTVLLLYWYFTRTHDFWKERGVPFVKPVPMFGNLLDIYGKSVHELDMERYKKYGHVYGYFEGNRPVLSVSDPEIIRDIFVKDFSSFPSRRQITTGDNIFDSMLTVLTGEDWKRVRTIVSPTFTTGKIKKLLTIFRECSDTLVQNFRKSSEAGESIEVKRLYIAFTMDVIASSSFSTKIDSFNDPNNEFVKTASTFFNQNNWVFIIFLLFPKLLMLLASNTKFGDVVTFFKNATIQIIEERKRTGQGRNDFLQLLLDTMKEETEDEKDTSNIDEEDDVCSNYEEDVAQQIYKNVTSKKLSLDELIAQCILFFIAGSETTASTLSFATYLLAVHPEYQDKLREEVDRALGETNGELTYEAIQSMKYLDNVIAETLRLYPPFIRLERVAQTNYRLGSEGINIPKGTIITFPAYVVHRDPNVYPNPEEFDPERFSLEQRVDRDPFAYVPFGAGPRNCIAMRFALMEIKICLAHVIARFNIKKSPKTKVPLEFLFSTAFLRPKGLIVDMQIRADCPLQT